jgi:hypothetical protein
MVTIESLFIRKGLLKRISCSATGLVTDVVEADVHLFLAGDDLYFESGPGAKLTPGRDAICESTAALVTELRVCEALVAIELDPALRCVRV